MSTQRVLGLVLLVVGLVLLYFGYNASQSVGEQVVEGITGRFTSTTMWYLIGGITAIACGVFLGFFSSGRSAKV